MKMLKTFKDGCAGSYGSRAMLPEDNFTNEQRTALRELGALEDGELRHSGNQPSGNYGLPKIHKHEVPLRPIVSCTGSPIDDKVGVNS